MLTRYICSQMIIPCARSLAAIVLLLSLHVAKVKELSTPDCSRIFVLGGAFVFGSSPFISEIMLSSSTPIRRF
jgi:hypothetical protein